VLVVLVVVGLLEEVVVVVVDVDEPVVVVSVDPLEDPLEDEGVDELELGLDAAGAEVEELLEVVVVPDVPFELGDPDPLGAVMDELLDDLGGFATRPLWLRVFSTSCCTVATSEATALGVPLAPRAGSAFSWRRACSS
jgi:hypothetical protein